LLIRVGIPSPEFFGAASDSRSVLDSELATSEDLVGAGVTGDTTGIAVGPSTTITPSSRTAAPLTAADSITPTSATGALPTETPFTQAGVTGSTVLQRLTFSPVHAPARSAALITAEMPEAFPPVADQASEAASMAAPMAVADGTRECSPLGACENLSRTREWRRKSCCS